MIEVRRAIEDDAWDALVRADPAATFAHLAGWRTVMAEVFGHEVLYLGAAEGDGPLEGVLPLVRVRSRLFGHYLVSMPFLNSGGVLGSSRARAALTAHAVVEARRSGADLLELRSRGTPATDLVISHRKITHTLPLPSTAETLWDALPSKVRSQVRRAMKERFVVRQGPEEIGAFYDVFTRHMRVLGTPVLPFRWFESIARRFAPEFRVVVVYDGPTPVAGGCGFVWREECEITWASARREWNRSAPNMLLYWHFMQAAIGDGATSFDFGRCTPGGATHAFKRQWGGEDRPLPWGQWRRGTVSATPTPEGPLFRAATACWRRLPLAVTNALGPRLARCLP